MTDDELKGIEGEADGDCSNCMTLLTEVRRLKAENVDMAMTWIPPDIARAAVASGQAAVAEKIAQLVETMTDEHRRQGHATLGYQLNDARRDQYRAIAAFIRMSMRDALR